ncbi:hypothetical protein LOZ13_006440 [Ophidiomyces ophidiicola]|nr:hypothetical protein LOZ13_006440 [Ophidiomyces ophidiicola]
MTYNMEIRLLDMGPRHRVADRSKADCSDNIAGSNSMLITPSIICDKPLPLPSICDGHISFLKVSALLEELDSLLNWVPDPYVTCPPPYDDALGDLPPEYIVEDAPLARKDPPRCAFLPSPDHEAKGALSKPANRLIDWNDSSRFKGCAGKKGKKAKANNKKSGGNSGGGGGNNDPPPNENDAADEGGADAGAGAGGDGGDGGNGGDGAGGGDGDGGEDEFWNVSSSKKKKSKKKKQEEEEEEERKRKEAEEEEERKKKEEEEQKAKQEELFNQTNNNLSWADDAEQDDSWFTPTTKKKKGKKGKASDPAPAAAENTQSNSFQDISLDDVPQIDLSFDKPSGDSFEFGTWGKNWKSGFRSGEHDGDSADKGEDSKTKEPESTNPWSTTGKTGKKSTNIFDLDFGTMGNEADESAINGDPVGGGNDGADEFSWTTPVGKKGKKKKKGASDPEPSFDDNKVDVKGSNDLGDAPVIVDPVPQDNEPKEWGGWNVTKSKKKKNNAPELPEPEPEPPVAAEPDPPVEDTWSITPGKKGKKKKQISIVEEIPVVEVPVETIEEVKAETNADAAADDEFLEWATTSKKSKKKKGKNAVEEAPAPPPPLPEVSKKDVDPEPTDDFTWETPSSKKDKKKKGKNAPVVEEPPPPPPEPEKAPETAPVDDLDVWGTAVGKKGKKKKGKNVVEPTPVVSDPVPDPPPEPKPEPPAPADDLWSWDNVGSNKKNKGKKEKTTEEVKEPDPVPEPEPEAPAAEDFSFWETGTKKKKGKKGKTTEEVKEPDPAPEPEPEASAAEDFSFWETGTKKKKGKKGKADPEPAPEPVADPEPESVPVLEAEPLVDECAVSGKKKKGKKGKEVVEEPLATKDIDQTPAPEPEPEPDVANAFSWATSTTKKKKGKKGKEESIPNPPAPREPSPVPEPAPESEAEPVEEWSAWGDVSGKKKKGKKGKEPVEEAPSELKEIVPEPKPEPPKADPLDDFFGASVSTKKGKKKKGKDLVEEPLPEPVVSPEETEPPPADDWAEFPISKKKKGKKGASDPTPPVIDDIPAPPPAENDVDLKSSSKKDKRKAGKGATKEENLEGDAAGDGFGDVGFGDPLLKLDSTPEVPKEESAWNDVGVSSKKKKGKKGVLSSDKKSVSDDLEKDPPEDTGKTEAIDLLDDIEPSKSTKPDSSAADPWTFFGVSKKTKTKATKTKGPDGEFPVETSPPLEEPTLSTWAQDWGLSSKEKAKDRASKNQGIRVDDVTDSVETGLVPKPADGSPWDIWGISKTAKKKKGKDESELPPPAPTPPTQGINPVPPIPNFDDAVDITWNSFSGSGSRGLKQGSLSRMTTSASKTSKFEKLSKTKTRGLEVVDITDEPGTEPVIETKSTDAAPVPISIWGGYTSTSKSKSSKSKKEEPAPYPEPEPEPVPEPVPDEPAVVVDEEPPPADTKTSKKSKRKAKAANETNAKAVVDTVDDVSGESPDKASAGPADDKAAPAPKATTSSSSARVGAKASVAERIRILEQNRKQQKEAAAAKEKEKEKAKAKDLPPPDPPPAPAPPADEPVEPPAQEPPEPAASEKEALPSKQSKKEKRKSKKHAPVPEPVIDDAPGPQESAPGSFPNLDDDLIDVSTPSPDPPTLKASSSSAKKMKKNKKSSALKKSAEPEMASPPPSPIEPDEAEGGDADPSTPAPKAVKKERARVERTAGATWGFWGATPRKSPKKEMKAAGDDEAALKKEKERPTTLKRSKSAATRREKPDGGDRSPDKLSISEKEKDRRPPLSRQNKGLSFSNFMLGGAAPTRTRSIKRTNGASRPASRRQSVDIDDSGAPPTPPEESPEISSKAAKVMGISDSKPSRRSSKIKKKAAAPDPYPIDDEDIVMVNSPEVADPPAPKEPRDSRKRKSKRESRAKATELADDIVMVEPGSSGHGPEVVSGPDDIAFVESPSKERPPLRRSTTMPKKPEGGLFGIFGSFRRPAGRSTEPRERGKSRSYYDEDTRRQTDTEREDARRLRREEKKRRAPKPGTNGEEAEADGAPAAGPNTDAEEIEARKAERRARRAAQHVAEQEAREAEERRARRKENERREAREKRAREEEEREERRRQEKKARRRAAQEEPPNNEEEPPADEPRTSHRRSRHRAAEADMNGEPPPDPRAHRRRSYVGEKQRDYPDDYAAETRHRRHRRPDDEASKSRRHKSRDEHQSSRKSRSSRPPADLPYPVMINGGKDKTSSWIHSQYTDPPEVPPIMPTVVDLPAQRGDANNHSLSSDEEARRAIHHRSRNQAKYDDADRERRRRHRESRRVAEKEVRSSEGSGDRYLDHRYEPDGRYAYGNGSSKRTSWFKKITGF